MSHLKSFIERLLLFTRHQAGYTSVLEVPFVPAGFFYMLACMAALHWRSWQFLEALLHAKFEWYYQSRRPLYDYGFHMSCFFNSEALGRRADRTHDLFREVILQDEFLDALALSADEMLSVYSQTQMVHCLRSAQEAEAGSSDSIWADFGRFYEYRVLQLLDRVFEDEEYGAGIAALFNEDAATWKSKLNERLAFVKTQYFGRGGGYFWESVARYEAR